MRRGSEGVAEGAPARSPTWSRHRAQVTVPTPLRPRGEVFSKKARFRAVNDERLGWGVRGADPGHPLISIPRRGRARTPVVAGAHVPGWLVASTGGIRAVDHASGNLSGESQNPMPTRRALARAGAAQRAACTRRQDNAARPPPPPPKTTPRRDREKKTTNGDPGGSRGEADCQFGIHGCRWATIASGVRWGSNGIGYCARRGVRHPERPPLMHHAAGACAGTQTGQTRASGLGRAR